MIYPNYKKDNIVNLTSAILKAFGQKGLYSPLKELEPLKNYKNVVLLLIDGLGYEYLQKYGKGSFLFDHCTKRLTTVYPSATAAAATALERGVPVQQHGISGWFMYLKELGLVSTILPFQPRYGGQSFPNDKIHREDIFTEKRIGEKIKAPFFLIYPEHIVDGKVNKKGKNLLTHSSMSELFVQLKKALTSSNRRKYIHAYWPRFDHLCHTYGCASKQVREHFEQIDKKIASFAQSLEGTNTCLIVTADHGLIDSPKSKTVLLDKHPKLKECLSMPLCGEPRAPYCYVRPAKIKQFENYVKTKLKHCCQLLKSSDAIKKGLFGLHKPHPKLEERVGDYVLLMKESYMLRDQLLKEEMTSFIGVHGGLSKEEMYVPLIVIDEEQSARYQLL